MAMILPSSPRPATAVAGKADVRDDNIYSALVLANGGQGTATIFTVPKGQSVPALKGASITALSQARHNFYTGLTTNLDKAGELGSIGDAAVRAIGFTFEQAAYASNFDSTAALAQRYFGATPFEVADVDAKCLVELKVSQKRQIIGPVQFFPKTGGPSGSLGIATNVTAGAAVGYVAGIANNGEGKTGRVLHDAPILIARNDVLALDFTAADALAFSDTAAYSAGTHEGQPFLVWCHLLATVSGDVR